jgi:hypothetical protein
MRSPSLACVLHALPIQSFSNWSLIIFGDGCQFFFMKFSPTSYYVGHVRSKYFSHDSVLKHPQSEFSLCGKHQVSNTYKTTAPLYLCMLYPLRDDVLAQNCGRVSNCDLHVGLIQQAYTDFTQTLQQVLRQVISLKEILLLPQHSAEPSESWVN